MKKILIDETPAGPAMDATVMTYHSIQICCPNCGFDLDGMAELVTTSFITTKIIEIWCLNCGWYKEGREAEYEWETVLLELSKDFNNVEYIETPE